jgi:hypothetical protein
MCHSFSVPSPSQPASQPASQPGRPPGRIYGDHKIYGHSSSEEPLLYNVRTRGVCRAISC